MSVTEQRVLEETKEVLGFLMHQPMETKIAKELFQSMVVSLFRFSAAQMRCSQAELDELQSAWVQAYKCAGYLVNDTANDVFIFPKKWGGEELNYPPPSTSSRRNSLITSADAWCTMMWRSPSPFKNFIDPRMSGFVTCSMSSTTRWSSFHEV